MNREERLQTQFEQSLQQQEEKETGGMDGVPMLQDNEAVAAQEYNGNAEMSKNGVSTAPVVEQ